MLKTRLKKHFFKTADCLSPFNLIRKLNKGPLVLVYHGVEKELINPRVQTLHIPLPTFEQQMDFLRRSRQVISMDDLYSCFFHNHPLDPSHILITFDDGYKNNRSLAAPLLESLGFPFSVFISTRHVEERRRFPIYRLRAALHYAENKKLAVRCLDTTFDLDTKAQRGRALEAISGVLKTSPRRLVESIVQDVTGSISEARWLEIDHLFSSEEPMDWGDIRQLSDRGVTIGSHCHDHFILNASQEPAEIEYQLSTSKRLIEQNAGRCSYIAYPNGGKEDITPGALRMVRDNRYLLGFTSVKGVIRDGVHPFLLARVFAPDDLDRFKFRVKNACLYHPRYSRWAGRLSGAERPN